MGENMVNTITQSYWRFSSQAAGKKHKEKGFLSYWPNQCTVSRGLLQFKRQYQSMVTFGSFFYFAQNCLIFFAVVFEFFKKKNIALYFFR